MYASFVCGLLYSANFWPFLMIARKQRPHTKYKKKLYSWVVLSWYVDLGIVKFLRTLFLSTSGERWGEQRVLNSILNIFIKICSLQRIFDLLTSYASRDQMRCSREQILKLSQQFFGAIVHSTGLGNSTVPRQGVRYFWWHFWRKALLALGFQMMCECTVPYHRLTKSTEIFFVRRKIGWQKSADFCHPSHTNLGRVHNYKKNCESFVLFNVIRDVSKAYDVQNSEFCTRYAIIRNGLTPILATYLDTYCF